MSVNTLNASTHHLSGQAFYMRLQEAANRTSPTETLRQLRQLLEQLFRYLTKEEARSFGNLFARMQFFFDKYPVPATLQEQLTALRIHTHKAVIGTLTADTELSLVCVQTMANAIQHFCEVPVPEILTQHCLPVQGSTLAYTPQLSAALVPQLKCLVIAIGPLQKRSDQVPYFILDCRNDDLGTFQLMIAESVQPYTTLLHAQLRVYDTVHILHCSKTEAPGLYEAVNTTRIILEPDLLIDISDLAECFGRQGAGKLLYLVKKLVPQTPGVAAFKGMW